MRLLRSNLYFIIFFSQLVTVGRVEALDYLWLGRTPVSEGRESFSDASNWVYTPFTARDVPGTSDRATFNNNNQVLTSIGSDVSGIIIGGTHRVDDAYFLDGLFDVSISGSLHTGESATDTYDFVVGAGFTFGNPLDADRGRFSSTDESGSVSLSISGSGLLETRALLVGGPNGYGQLSIYDEVLQANFIDINNGGITAEPDSLVLVQAGTGNLPGVRNGITLVGENSLNPAVLRVRDGAEWIGEGQVTIGIEGHGRLFLEPGASMQSGYYNSPTFTSGAIGGGVGALGEVFMDTNSSWTQDGAMTVGFSGAGILKMDAGSRLDSRFGLISRLPGSSGEVIIDGQGSVWKTDEEFIMGGDFSLSSGADAEVVVKNGGRLAVGTRLGLFASGVLDLTGQGEGGGTVVVGSDPDVFLSPGTLKILPDGSMFNAGTINANVVLGGVFNPGSSIADSTINGDLILESGGTIVIEIGGKNSFDRLGVSGQFDASDGELVFRFVNGYSPKAGTQYEFLGYSELVSQASSTRIENLVDGFQYSLVNVPNGIALFSESDGVFIPEPSLATLILTGLLVRRGVMKS
ncbi:MAG: hypothetical protein RIG82_11950 [Phycisphaeraceae bacterium]